MSAKKTTPGLRIHAPAESNFLSVTRQVGENSYVIGAHAKRVLGLMCN